MNHGQTDDWTDVRTVGGIRPDQFGPVWSGLVELAAVWSVVIRSSVVPSSPVRFSPVFGPPGPVDPASVRCGLIRFGPVWCGPIRPGMSTSVWSARTGPPPYAARFGPVRAVRSSAVWSILSSPVWRCFKLVRSGLLQSGSMSCVPRLRPMYGAVQCDLVQSSPVQIPFQNSPNQARSSQVSQIPTHMLVCC